MFRSVTGKIFRPIVYVKQINLARCSDKERFEQFCGLNNSLRTLMLTTLSPYTLIMYENTYNLYY